MRNLRVLFLEDFAFENNQSLSSFQNLVWLKRYLKIEIQPIWVFQKNMLYENILGNRGWLHDGDIIFLSAHGSSGRLYFGNTSVDIDDLAESLSGIGKGLRLFISSCGFFDVDVNRFDFLQQETKFQEVAGYVDSVTMNRDFGFEREFLLDWLSE